MDVITYSLRNGQPDAGRYYREVAAFSEEVLEEAGRLVGDIAEIFLRTQNPLTQPAFIEECLLELLTLGTLWRIYGCDAAGLPHLPCLALTRLTSLRRRNKRLRPGLDLLYGLLRGLFDAMAIRSRQLEGGLKGFDSLLGWLATADIFYYEYKRLRVWRDFFAAQTQEAVAGHVSRVLALAEWFERRSEEVLGVYTAQVEQFRIQSSSRRRWREDYLFCNRKPVEYHLNMVGAEILNGVFRSAFNLTGRKTVLLPACMCHQQQGVCRAQPEGTGYRCVHCTPQCRVSELTGMGRKYGFAVCIVPHSSSLFMLSKAESIRDAGVVGIACVTNLLHGGWMLQASGIPAQCVLLDYCGCRAHWHKEGIPTDIDEGRLAAVLNIDSEVMQG